MTTPAEEFYSLLPQLPDKKVELRLNKLLENGGDLFYEGDFGTTTLHMAVMFDLQEGFDVLVERLMKSNSDVLDRRNSIGFTALHEAAQWDMFMQAEVLVRKGANVNASTLDEDAQEDAQEMPIHIAARFGSLHCLRVLLENGARVDAPNNLRERALHIAAGINHVECVRLLLDHKADVKLRDVNSFTPLHVAASVGSVDVVKLLFASGVNLKEKTSRGWTSLHLAAHKNQYHVIEELLSQCDNKNDPNSQGQTPLHLAVKIKPDVAHSVKLLLKQNVDIKLKDNKGRTALHVAIQRGNIICVQELLKNGADKDRKDKAGSSPLHLALQFQDFSLTPVEQATYRDACVQKLLLKGAKISSDKTGLTPLHIAAKYDNTQVIMDLLNRGADINAQDKNGMTPLHVATICGKHVFVQTLLDRGLKQSRVDAGKGIIVDAKDSQGRTALYIAVAFKCIECAEALLSKGADATCQNDRGLTPLHKAAYVGDENLMEELLLKTPLDLEGEDQEGWRAVHVAAAGGADKCLSLLLSTGAKVNPAMPASLFTPLHMSAQAGHKGCIAVLLKYGADVQALTVDGETALKLADVSKEVACMALLDGQAGGGGRAEQAATGEHGSGIVQESKGDITTDSVPFRRPLYEDIEEDRVRQSEAMLSGNLYTVRRLEAMLSGDQALPICIHAAPSSPVTPEADTCEKRLMLDGNRINKTNCDGTSCLHREAALNHADHLQTLLDKRADPRKQNNDNKTPLHVAAEVGAAECVAVLVGVSGAAHLELKDKNNCTPLHLASSCGNERCVEILLEKGKPQNLLTTKNRLGENALHLASSSGHAKCLEAILAKLGDCDRKRLIETRTGADSLALHLAAEQKHDECVRLLVSYGADLTSVDNKKQTVFEITVAKNSAACLQYLLPEIKENKDKILSDLLFVAVKYDAPECLAILIDNEADILFKNEQNMTAMQIAMDRHHISCVKVLLDRMATDDKMAADNMTAAMKYAAKNGYRDSLEVMTADGSLVDVNAIDVDGLTALQKSAAHGHVDCVDTLIARGADVNAATEYGYSALHLAARDGHASCVRLLLQHSAHVDAVDLRNTTPLHFAAKENRIECLKFLLEANANVNSQTQENWTAIHWASKNGHVECVQMLVDNGADYNITTVQEFTPLRFAVGGNHFNVVSFLVVLPNIQLNTRDRNTENALHVATRAGFLECGRILLEYGADVNEMNGNNNTALNIAAKRNRPDFIKMLVEKGAVIDNVDRAGFTPLLSAAMRDFVECINILVTSGANLNYADDKTCKTALHYAVLKHSLERVKLYLQYGANTTKRDDNGFTPLELAKRKGCNADILKALEDGGR